MLARTLHSERFHTKTRRQNSTEEFYSGKKVCWVFFSTEFLTGFGQTQRPTVAHRTLGADVGLEVWLPGSTGRGRGEARTVRRERDRKKVCRINIRF